MATLLALSGRLLGREPAGTPFPVEMTFATAYLGGVLALLSPCSGAILPAFFGYSFRDSGRLVLMTYVFYLGLALVFVPLGFATSLVGGFFQQNRNLVFLAGGLLLLGMGVLTVLSFDFSRLVPARLRPSTAERSPGPDVDVPRVFALGAVFGFATSSCTAPIIGAIQTLAVGSALDSASAILLFLVFALGIVTPLFILAWFFDRRGVGSRLRGRVVTLRLGRRAWSLHTHHLVTGIVLILLGILFIAFRGTLDLTESFARLGATELAEELNFAVLGVTSGVGGVVLSLVGIALLAGYARRRWARARHAADIPPKG